MSHSEFQLRGLTDPRLAAHATGALPAWLWSSDGTRILWANPVGARLFGAASRTGLVFRTFGPADPQRRQIAQLAPRLPLNGAIRLQRLRGFGAPLGTLMTCGCARLDFSDSTLDFSDSTHGVLIVAHTNGLAMPLAERLVRLVEGIEAPVAAFTRDGGFVAANNAARPLLDGRDLADAGLDAARNDALSGGRVETSSDVGHIVLQRVGRGTDVALVALVVPDTTPKAQIGHSALAGFELVDEFSEPLIFSEPLMETAKPPTPDDERPALASEAPAEFAVIDQAVELPAEVPGEHQAEPVDSTREAMTSDREAPASEPSPYIEAVADEPDAPSTGELASWLEEAALTRREQALRFTWQIDADGCFWIGAGEFTDLIGPRTTAGLNRPWSEIAKTFHLDPDGRVAGALARRDTWSGITVSWPVDSDEWLGGEWLPVELAGLPVLDRMQQFVGYRGFGVCRDLDSLSRLAALRRFELSSNLAAPQRLSADIVPINFAQDLCVQDLRSSETTAANSPAQPDMTSAIASQLPARLAIETSPPTELERPVETSPNVVPFRPIGEGKSPSLTPVENNTFDELARQLSDRLDRDGAATAEPPPAAAEPSDALSDSLSDTLAEMQAAPPSPNPAEAEAATNHRPSGHSANERLVNEPPQWLAPGKPPARGEMERDRQLLDLLPTGILIYRLDRLLYANPAFLERIGYPSLDALEQLGGLDALYVEPGVSSVSSTSDAGTPVTISAGQWTEDGTEQASQAQPTPATEAHLFTISWDGESALALICSPASAAPLMAEMAKAKPARASAVGEANAEDLAAILDTTAEGIVMFDTEGAIHACNRSAEALFGYDGVEFVKRNLVELFAPESQRVVADYLAGIKGAAVASLLDHGRDVLGRENKGGIIPLSMTMGQTRPGGANFFAVFRDQSQNKKSELEPRAARQADRAANAKADMLARISHEVRTPLNAIIGFAEVMITERFGALGNERYVEYMKDIRNSGERVVAMINDLTELSRIESGQLDLTFANQNLNDLVESCVAVLQPQANRERIIIRSSLAHALPPVIADASALRQIALNLIGNSIRLANAGGQVIVSTALSDRGEVVLRVRDTGPGLNDSEVAAALEPFRNLPPSDEAPENSPVNLSLTKALVEANRAQFQIRKGPRSGTLIEVLFSHALARA
jgi:PAS domain S-box-containing protein